MPIATSDMPARIGKTTGVTLPVAKVNTVFTAPAKRKPKRKKAARKGMTGLINNAG